MKVFKVVLDTNVLVSGLRSKQGASYKLLTLLGKGRFTTTVSVPLVVEYEKALVDPRTKVPFSHADIGIFIDYICAISDKRKIYYLWRPRLPDPGDDMILELAVAGSCHYIVTYNVRDFRGVEQFGVKILTPKQFLKLFGEEL
ncbi:MAG: putative toxin-antitoxin system toxin component, PIN family [bacterium]